MRVRDRDRSERPPPCWVVASPRRNHEAQDCSHLLRQRLRGEGDPVELPDRRRVLPLRLGQLQGDPSAGIPWGGRHRRAAQDQGPAVLRAGVDATGARLVGELSKVKLIGWPDGNLADLCPIKSVWTTTFATNGSILVAHDKFLKISTATASPLTSSPSRASTSRPTLCPTGGSSSPTSRTRGGPRRRCRGRDRKLGETFTICSGHAYARVSPSGGASSSAAATAPAASSSSRRARSSARSQAGSGRAVATTPSSSRRIASSSTRTSSGIARSSASGISSMDAYRGAHVRRQPLLWRVARPPPPRRRGRREHPHPRRRGLSARPVPRRAPPRGPAFAPGAAGLAGRRRAHRWPDAARAARRARGRERPPRRHGRRGDRPRPRRRRARPPPRRPGRAPLAARRR